MYRIGHDALYSLRSSTRSRYYNPDPRAMLEALRNPAPPIWYDRPDVRRRLERTLWELGYSALLAMSMAHAAMDVAEAVWRANMNPVGRRTSPGQDGLVGEGGCCVYLG